MPKVHTLFARPHVALDRALLAEPALAGRVFQLASCEGLVARDGRPLTVVRLDDDDVDPDGWARDGEPDLAPALARFPWLAHELPPRARLARLDALARAHDADVAWFYWHERGDDLYEDAALMLGRERRLFARQVMGHDASACVHLDDGTVEPWSGSPLVALMDRLGIDATTQYFVPEDDRDFEWERHRIQPTRPVPA